jgi:hypothetical protein
LLRCAELQQGSGKQIGASGSVLIPTEKITLAATPPATHQTIKITVIIFQITPN